MRFSQFQGILGGRPGQALFILGLLDDDFLYLDPHRVQPFSMDPATYSQQDILAISESEIDTSCGITFYFDSLQSIAEFYAELLWMKYETFNLLFYFNTQKGTTTQVI